ncbi:MULTISPECIES: hypothetical protein [Thalassospira]|uniref:PRTase-CE domain-containing protein n=1 Tax=Thalassospira profundimaris TaxID=502049 RepID=A0A367V6Q1_9PROT|nr:MULTISPECIES: hypothetical protein [Thalassospira]KZB70491.1 hypothetical protein AUQ43_14265 [Thalassospira sp. MCCC 1A01148]MBR9901804.1 hypothetical protein [Rhodospirillales bacterium]RCK20867.1 hypothetical protein TH6_13850 [Thalassospira profundimaris]
MSDPWLFIIVSTQESQNITQELHDKTSQLAETHVSIFSPPEKLEKGGYQDALTKHFIEAIESAGVIHNTEFSVILDRNVKCNVKTLESQLNHEANFKSLIRHVSIKTIRTRMTNHIMENNSHWRTYATDQISRYNYQTTKLETWHQQFGQLQHPTIGRMIASQLRVESLNKITVAQKAFIKGKSDSIGQKQQHCVIADGDQGGSWQTIDNDITHLTQDNLPPAEWDEVAKTIKFPDSNCHELVVYEDALWSGYEFCNHLNAMSDISSLPRIQFKFAIITDFGLRIARHAIRHSGLHEKLYIDTNNSQLIYFLDQDLPTPLQYGEGLSPDDYFEELHKHVTPAVFSRHQWTDRDKDACREIGRQLVRHWLRRKGCENPTDEQIDKYSLGGGRFGSAILLSHSIPKVCLPLLWLDGPVSLNGKTINWRPLFIDPRRVKDVHVPA